MTAFIRHKVMGKQTIRRKIF